VTADEIIVDAGPAERVQQERRAMTVRSLVSRSRIAISSGSTGARTRTRRSTSVRWFGSVSG
jgi:hypothetical protein